MMKYVYFFLAMIGIVLPYSQFVPWTMTNGMDLVKMGQAMFVNQIAAGIALDALTAAVILIIYILVQQKKKPVKYFWLPIVGTFVFGLAFALPFYFYLREFVSEKE
ncbi:MAG: DUF2834 domain-containing protein [Candidatus Falkowbacteria bacterium]|nr:DUF2834 domain-containing protein [Candidatus Falkowbacteria bacterium]